MLNDAKQPSMHLAAIMTTNSLPSPCSRICLPPVLKKSWSSTAADAPHPAWAKIQRVGKHDVVSAPNLDDLTELADWARTALVEPDQPLSKAERQGYATVLQRVERWAVLQPLGPCHVIAVAWRQPKTYKQS